MFLYLELGILGETVWLDRTSHITSLEVLMTLCSVENTGIYFLLSMKCSKETSGATKKCLGIAAAR